MCGSEAVPTIRQRISAKKFAGAVAGERPDVRLQAGAWASRAEALLERGSPERLAVGELRDRQAVFLADRMTTGIR
jgi:hypothetical protein